MDLGYVIYTSMLFRNEGDIAYFNFFEKSGTNLRLRSNYGETVRREASEIVAVLDQSP